MHVCSLNRQCWVAQGPGVQLLLQRVFDNDIKVAVGAAGALRYGTNHTMLWNFVYVDADVRCIRFGR